jgi:hypothetical protein
MESELHQHQKNHQKKKSSWNYVAIILALLLIISVSYFCYDKNNYVKNNVKKEADLINKSYQNGFNEGMIEGAKQTNQMIINTIVSDLNNYNQTAVTLPTQNNSTMTIPLIPLTTIISQLNNNGKFSFLTIGQYNESIQVDLILPAMCKNVKTN